MIGIVAEYNPFHKGHSFLISEAKKYFGQNEPVVAIMSGDFVQRGEPAVRDKFSRAETALKSGCDLIFELPVQWSLSSAEGFARGAIGIINSIGCENLAFGTECGNLDDLTSFSEDIDSIKEYLKAHPDITYPKARSIISNNHILDGPNNILALEYLKYAANLNMFTVRRTTEHDGLYSAKDIRSTMIQPNLELPIVSRLKMFNKEYYNLLPDGDNGAGNRLYYAVKKYDTLNEIMNEAKSKNYTLSRIRRMIICAAIGIKKGDNKGIPPYARVLGFNEKGKNTLIDIKKNTTIPIITLPKQIYKSDMRSLEVFATGASARELYSLGIKDIQPDFQPNDYKNGPVIVNYAQ